MADPDQKAQLRDLEERINAAKSAGQDEIPHQEEHFSQAQLAWRMVIELVAGVGIGVGLGLGLDVLLGTEPIMLLIFLLLGLAAGVRTMMRSAAEVQKMNDGADAPRDEDT